MGLRRPGLESGDGAKSGEDANGVGSGRGRGNRSGVCWTFRRFASLGPTGWLPRSFSSEMGLRGLDGVKPRLRAGAERSRRAFRAALGFDETRDRGVKNLPNLRGVIDGFLRSLTWLDGGRGGEESKLLLSIAELLVPAGSLSVMAVGPHDRRPSNREQ